MSAITQAMLDAERELRRVEHQEHFQPRSEAEWANEGFEDGWDSCLAFLREHGTTFEEYVVGAPGIEVLQQFVRVEIPAR